MSSLTYQIIPVTAFSQNCSLLTCVQTRKSAIIDPGGDAEKIIQLAKQHELRPEKILLTHGHLDHVGAARELADYYKVPILGPDQRDQFLFEALPQQSEMFGFPPCDVFLPDQWLAEGDQLSVGEIQFDILHCPGHTPGHIVFYDAVNQLLFSGDVIFRGGVGRTDFPRGNSQQLITSITEKLLPLGDEITFIPGHGPISTLGFERLNNPFLK